MVMKQSEQHLSLGKYVLHREVGRVKETTKGKSTGENN
jgi:hypothetical protein